MATGYDRRLLAWFLGLCFGASWSLGIGALVSGLRFDDPRMTASGRLLAAGCMSLPALSAWLTRKLGARAGIALPDAGMRFGPWRAYVVIWILAPSTVFACYALSRALGFARFTPVDPASSTIVLRMISAGSINLLATSLFTFGEEYGWTGLLLPWFLARGLRPIRAAIAYGTIWGTWHWPLIWAGHNYPGRPFVGSVMMVALCIGIGLVQTATRLRTQSVLATSFVHAGLNSWANGFEPMFPGIDPVLAGPTGVIGIVVWLALGLLWLPRASS